MGPEEEDGQIHTLGLLEQLREDLWRYGHENGELYHRVDKVLRELANPNLHDVELAHAIWWCCKMLTVEKISTLQLDRHKKTL